MRPRLLLILCEGKTEKLYFDIVIRKRRIYVVNTVVFGQKGVHESLIEKCVEERRAHAREYGVEESEIEVWAVCDCDGWKGSYQELLQFASNRQVNLAFSNPQFETYLVQHLVFRNTINKKKKLEAELSELLGFDYDKANLDWLDEMLDNEPAKLEFALKNADNFAKHTKVPFLTVQDLTRRLLEFAL